MANAAAGREHLRELIAPIITEAGFDLEDLVVTPAGRRSLVRVVVDGEDGVSLDQVAELSRSMSSVLDEEDAAMGRSPYVLEVTSPGVDRPLTDPRHWRRATGRRVSVQVHDVGPLTGRVLRSDGSGVVLDVDGDERELSYGSVTSARVEVEFNRPEGAGPIGSEGRHS